MKSKFFMPLVAAMLFASCSSDEPVAIPGDSDDVAGAKYLTVNLVSTPDNAGSKAGGDQSTGAEPGNATYEEGYASENKVNAVRFYFFDNDGNIAAVKANGNNYVDWSPVTEEDKDMPNVEKILSPTIVISTKAGDLLPTSIVAVINPNTEALGTENLTLTQLRNRTKDYVAAATGTDGAFVMINSVYSQNGEIAATAVSPDNYASTEEVAKTKPVNIYVERCVAKVRVTLGTDVQPTNGLIALKDSEGKAITVGTGDDNKQVYLKIGKWNITAETDKGYLSKHIDATWNASLFGGNEAWNYAPFFRSFWAINTNEAKQSWHNFDDIAANGGKDYDGELANSIYTNENAPQTLGINANSTGAAVEPFTKVIIAGELVYEDGTPIEICKYAGAKIIGESNLKKLLLENLANNGMIYSYVTTEAGTSYTSLKDEDVEFVTGIHAALGNDTPTASESTQGRHYVYLQLSAVGAAKKWSKSDKKDQTDADRFLGDNATNDVNAYLAKQIGHAQIHKGGLTYYYFPIRHLGNGGETNAGYYGVVRNHIYNCTITKIAGLGTAVYDPKEVIYPEKPENEETFIAAHIKILSWRVVNNNVDLDW